MKTKGKQKKHIDFEFTAIYNLINKNGTGSEKWNTELKLYLRVKMEEKYGL